MTSEEIIQRLLDEKKITVKEAMIILKDLAKIGLKQVLPDTLIPDNWQLPNNGSSGKPLPPHDVVVMYGVTATPYTWSNENTTFTTFGTCTTSNSNNEADEKEKEDE